MCITENKLAAALRARLFALGEADFREFNSKLMPTVDKDRVIGVRTPILKKLAAELDGSPQADEFLALTPHYYFEENNLHAFLIARICDFSRVLDEIDRFLPFVDNWATCDQLSPAVFRKNKGVLLEKIKEWLKSEHTYTVRFGIGMLMRHYLDEDFDPEYPRWVARVDSEDYYLRMMVAWYFATALAKQYEEILPFIEQRQLPIWTHNKAIGKAVESRRIASEKKRYLKQLRINHRKEGLEK